MPISNGKDISMEESGIAAGASAEGALTLDTAADVEAIASDTASASASDATDAAAATTATTANAADATDAAEAVADANFAAAAETQAPQAESASEPAAKKSGRVVKGVIGTVLALAFFALCNWGVTLAYETYGSNSQVIWYDYSKQSDIDTVIVGTSFSQCGLDPFIIDKKLGSKSYSLSSPAQSLEDSFIGIQTAYEDYGIKRAILSTSQSAMTTEGQPDAQSAFLYQRSKYVSPAQTLSALNQMLWHYGASVSDSSINMIFPWIKNHIKPTLQNFERNITGKLTGGDMIAIGHTYDPRYQYVGRGHGVYTDVTNYNTCDVYQNENDEEAEGEVELEERTPEEKAKIDPDRANTLREICEYCKARDIELIFVTLPISVFEVIDPEKHYYDYKAGFDALCSELGMVNYDFNFVKQDVFMPKEEYFHNRDHFNKEGAEVFSNVLGEFLAAREAGVDIGTLFMPVENLEKSIDYIPIVLLTDTVDAEGIHLNARAVAGPSVQAEYKFLAEDDEGHWKAIRGWSTDPDFIYTPSERGKVHHLRVYTRQVGDDVKYERYRSISEMF